MPRLLVYSKTVGFRHDSIAEGVEALTRLSRKRGWDLEATEDPSSFHASRLARFELVLFLNTNGNVLDDAGRQALIRFVRSKKAFVAVHGAAATEPDWTWFGGLVGATFKAHPAIQPALVSVTDASHPSTRHLPTSWRRTDEWYGFHESPRDNVRVLLTLDESSYEPGDGAMGADHPPRLVPRVRGQPILLHGPRTHQGKLRGGGVPRAPRRRHRLDARRGLIAAPGGGRPASALD